MWLAKLKRMMDELPERYLQPEAGDPEELALIPPGSKPVSQLTEEEQRLDGVCRQLYDMAELEFDAHKALHGQDESTHPPGACLKHNAQMRLREEEMELVWGILMRSLNERLGFENDHVVDGHDVYAIPSILTSGVVVRDIRDVLEELPDDVDIPGFRGWPENES